MALQTVEAPGGLGLQVLCPHCSRSHPAEDYPARCRRCGTMMDGKVSQSKVEVKPLDPASVPE